MSRSYGVAEATAPLRRVLMRPPGASFAVEDPRQWSYRSRPHLERARAEHRQLVRAIESAGAEVILHDASLPGLADSVFVFDPAFMTPAGAVLLRMGKELRRGEEEALGEVLGEVGVPIIGRLEGGGTVEGGDLLRLDAHTVALGLGFRTDRAGHGALAAILERQQTEVLAFDLPCVEGERACLHLRSLVSPLAPDLAVAYRPLLPVRLWRELTRRFEIVDVPDAEFRTLAVNVLALAPRRCLMLAGNPITRGRLQRAGCEVVTYEGEELSLKADGGPTCLTLPLWRSTTT